MPHQSRTSPTHSPDALRQLRAEARNPATSPDRLRALGQDLENLDRRVLEALAANASTPPDILASLIVRAPAAFCRNPAAALLALEDPSFADRISGRGAGGMLRSPRAPATLVAQIAQWKNTKRLPDRADVDLSEAALLHRTFGDLGEEREWQAAVRRYWADYVHRESSDEDTHALLELTELGCLPPGFGAAVKRFDPLGSLTPDAMRSRATPAQQLAMERGARREVDKSSYNLYDAEAFELLGAALVPGSRLERLEKYVHGDPDLAAALAQNQGASPELLRRLVVFHAPAVRRLARRHPNFPSDTFEWSRSWLLRRSLCTRLFDLRGYYGKYLPINRDLLGALVQFTALQQTPEALRRPMWSTFARSPVWQDRLAAAVSIGPRPNGLPARPKHLALLRMLAEDGNRLVCAAARGRLRGESFSW